MEIKINIDEETLKEQVTCQLARSYFADSVINREIRNVVGRAVKEIVYSQKDKIIEMCINRATRELVKKGLPQLIDKFDDSDYSDE